MMSSEARQQVWIGLVEVRQRPGAGVLMDRNGAHVNVLAMAASSSGYHRAVAEALDNMGFDLVEIEDPEPLCQRRQAFEVSDDLLALANEVAQDGVTRMGTFFTWMSNDTTDGQAS